MVGNGALLTYGDGLGALVVHETASSEGGLSGSAGSLPKVSLAPCRRMARHAARYVARVRRRRVSFVVGGSMKTDDAEAAAKAFA